MDPISALSVASAIVQFVDFGNKLVGRGVRIYKSRDGALSEYVDKEVAADYLTYLNKNLRDSIRAKPSGSIAKEDSALYDLCSKCQNLGEELLAHFAALKVNGTHRKWKSFRQALRSVWSEEALNEIEKRLAVFRNEIEFHILVDLRKNIDLLSIQQSQQFHILDQAAQQMTEALLKNHHVFADDLSAQTMAISRLHKQTEEVVKVGFDRVSNDIIKEIRIERGNTIFGIAPPEVGNNRSSTTSRHGDLLEEKRLCEDFVLESLHFRSMHNRHEDIAEVHRDTFKWMIEQESRNDEKTSELHGNDFVDWLRRGDGIYWISGKAGSGKSTLMKHLYENSQTRQHLQSWAQSGILLIAGHFFWNSGTSEQRSQRGLFRSLLFEIFRAQRHLIPTVLPELWQELKPFAEKARKWSRPISEIPLAPYQGWGLPRLHQIFKALTKIPKISTKICFFIDGLDEYEGEGSHLELVDNLKSLTSSSNVKICVSSRPWLVFEDAFSDLPGVRLEDLTFYDISSFVADKLGSHPRMKKLCRDEPEEAPKLTGEIVAKAHGVFLWVELVVRSLLNGLGNRDRISDLRRRLRLLPEELEDLYRAMLLRIDPVYRLQASQIFQLVQADQGEDNDTGFNNSVERTPLTVLRLAFADIEDAISIAVESPIALLTADEITSICEWMDQKLKSRCAGLLGSSKSKTKRDWTDNTRCEVLKYSIDSRVAYLYRTARDFLSRPETQSLLLSWNSDAEFDCSTKLLAACVLRVCDSTAFLRPKGPARARLWSDGPARPTYGPVPLLRRRNYLFPTSGFYAAAFLALGPLLPITTMGAEPQKRVATASTTKSARAPEPRAPFS